MQTVIWQYSDLYPKMVFRYNKHFYFNYNDKVRFIYHNNGWHIVWNSQPIARNANVACFMSNKKFIKIT